jgi:hypothetical protein
VGWAVALSADGNTALIGGPGDSGENGAAWVFTRTGGTWGQQSEKLTGGCQEGTLARFGSSVALSSAGDTALIGGPEANEKSGAAWVFTRSLEGVWSQQGGKLTGSGEEGQGNFGSSVALSADGNTALIGGPLDRESSGAAWVFTGTGGTWTQQGAKLTGEGEVGGGRFGQSVALSSAGTSALIGGSGDSGSQGAAWGLVNSNITTSTTTTHSTATTTTTTSECPTTTTSTTTTSPPTSSTATTVTAMSPISTSTSSTSAQLPPTLANVTESHRIWREPGSSRGARARTRIRGPGPAARAANAHAATKAPLGTVFSFTLNEPATVSLTFMQMVSGRRTGGRCVAQVNANRRRPACKRAVVAGTLSYAGHGGKNTLSFQGRISRSRWLIAGSYALTLTATSAAGERSSAKTLSFTIVR